MAGTYNIKVSRGGRFNNGGHLSLFSIGNFSDIVNKLSPYLFEDDEHNLRDDSGNIVGQLNSDGSIPEYGVIDIDGDYESYYTNHIEDANDEEISLFCNLIIDDKDYIEDDTITEYLIDNGYIQHHIDYYTSLDKDEIIEDLWMSAYTPYKEYRYIPKRLIEKILKYYSDEYSDFYKELKEDWL